MRVARDANALTLSAIVLEEDLLTAHAAQDSQARDGV